MVNNTHVRGHAVSEQPDRGRSDQARRRGEMDLRAASRTLEPSASPAATSSIAAPATRTARSSTACSTRTSSPSMPRAGSEVWRTTVGEHQPRRDDHRRRRSSSRTRCWSATRGGELGVRGYVAALDVKTGKELWRAFNTGPDADVQIGPAFHAFYAKDQGKDLASRPGREQWKLGGSTVWGWISYDPEPICSIYGTGNPGRLESGSAAGRQQVVDHDLRARRRHRRGDVGLPDRPRTTPGTTTRSWRTCSSTWTMAADGASC